MPHDDAAGRRGQPGERPGKSGARPSSDRGAADRGRSPRPDRSSGSPRPDRSGGPPREPKLEPLPEASPHDLPGDVRGELRSLAAENAERVARHLVSAGLLADDDPVAALAQARAARATAGRVASVREAVGVTAYLAGEWAEALSELRAARRMTGSQEHLALMADCERALGRPERAIAIAAEPGVAQLDREGAVELAIVVSGARRALGELDAAVVSLQGPELEADVVESWTLRLWYAYADALLAAGRRDEALAWFTSTAEADEYEETDAAERLAVLTQPADS